MSNSMINDDSSGQMPPPDDTSLLQAASVVVAAVAALISVVASGGDEVLLRDAPAIPAASFVSGCTTEECGDHANCRRFDRIEGWTLGGGAARAGFAPSMKKSLGMFCPGSVTVFAPGRAMEFVDRAWTPGDDVVELTSRERRLVSVRVWNATGDVASGDTAGNEVTLAAAILEASACGIDALLADARVADTDAQALGFVGPPALTCVHGQSCAGLPQAMKDLAAANACDVNIFVVKMPQDNTAGCWCPAERVGWINADVNSPTTLAHELGHAVSLGDSTLGPQNLMTQGAVLRSHLTLGQCFRANQNGAGLVRFGGAQNCDRSAARLGAERQCSSPAASGGCPGIDLTDASLAPPVTAPGDAISEGWVGVSTLPGIDTADAGAMSAALLCDHCPDPSPAEADLLAPSTIPALGLAVQGELPDRVQRALGLELGKLFDAGERFAMAEHRDWPSGQRAAFIERYLERVKRGMAIRAGKLLHAMRSETARATFKAAVQRVVDPEVKAALRSLSQ